MSTISLKKLIEELLETESNYVQTVRWREGMEKEIEDAQKRMRVLDTLCSKLHTSIAIKSIKAFQAQVDDIALCPESTPQLQAKMIEELIKRFSPVDHTPPRTITAD